MATPLPIHMMLLVGNYRNRKMVKSLHTSTILWGALPKTTYPWGGTHESTYDSLGNKLTDIDPMGNVTKFSFDENGKPCVHYG